MLDTARIERIVRYGGVTVFNVMTFDTVTKEVRCCYRTLSEAVCRRKVDELLGRGKHAWWTDVLVHIDGVLGDVDPA